MQNCNSDQDAADRFYFEMRIKGGNPETIQDLYFKQFPGCNILQSLNKTDKAFSNIANKPHDIVVGQVIMKLESAHARAQAAGDISSAIAAAAKIAEVHRKFTENGTEKETRANKPKWA